MAASKPRKKKSSPEKDTRAQHGEMLAAHTEVLGYLGVMLEDIRAQMRMVIESMDVKVDAAKVSNVDQIGLVHERLKLLESAVVQSSREIGLRLEIQGLRTDFDSRVEEARIYFLEQRLDAIEQKMAE